MSRVRPVIVGGVLAALVLLSHVLSFVVTGRYRDALDVLHIAGFAALAIVLLPYARTLGERLQWSTAAAVLACLASITLFAFIAEALQILVVRDASSVDLVRDFGGIAAGAFVIGAFWSHGRRAVLLGALACICLVLAAWSPVRSLFATTVTAVRAPKELMLESPLDALLYDTADSRVDSDYCDSTSTT